LVFVFWDGAQEVSAEVVEGGAGEVSCVEGFEVCLDCVSEFGLGWVYEW
jgi:hypothetical protein